ncbi:MAG: 3-oxoacyl-ACP synthase III [Thermoguttaceae bacterium]
MKYQNVCVESFTYTLPEEILTTTELEQRLVPTYERLKLPEGRLELLTGIRERRLWPSGTLPGDQSVKTCQKLLAETEIDPSKVGALIHASVCRDFLEPATACGVHRRVGLPASCAIFDVSNACLGIATGMTQIAAMIELGEIEAGIVVGTESSRSLLDATVEMLNTDHSIDRKSIKKAFASLTIGSGSAAVLLTHKNISRTGLKLVGGVVHSNTAMSGLCESRTDQSGGDSMSPIMWTDSEQLMHEGIKTAKTAWNRFLVETGWSVDSINRFFTHQVGKQHQQLLFDTLGIDITKNFSTLEFLGNTGSVAMPTAAAIGLEKQPMNPGERIALFGIGSGINVVMLALE